MLGDFSTGAMAQLDLFDGDPLWQIKRQMLSPAYTTRLAYIP